MVAINLRLLNLLRGFVISLLCLAGLVSGLANMASADSYQVQASIPYPAPTQAAVFDSGLNGTTVSAALATLTGTCQVQNPADVVVIVRGATTLGSTACNGTFSIQVMLTEGDNVLTGRTVNASSLYGPDSTPITITLHLPPTVTPTPDIPSPAAPPSTPAEVTATTNSGAAADLVATTSEPFSVLTASNDVTIRVTVGGGSTPYTIILNWGDGSIESHTGVLAGEYSFSHNYEKAGNYAVRGTVRDAVGASSVFDYAVVSGKQTGTGGDTSGKAGTAASDSIFDTLRKYAVPAAVTGGVAVIAGAGYLLGIHNSAAQLFSQSSQSAQKRPSKARSTRGKQARRGPKRATRKR